jgi:hypothetical protein
MTTLAASSNVASVFPSAASRSHHGGQGLKTDIMSVASLGQPGQLPIGIGHSLMSNLAQTVQQVLSGHTSSLASASAATASAASPQVTQDAHHFMHALFQALNTSGSGTYQPGMAASLQNLIQQISAGGAPTPATAELTASFNQLTQDLGTNGKGASLQNLLNGFLQKVQGTGNVSPMLVGANINARV